MNSLNYSIRQQPNGNQHRISLLRSPSNQFRRRHRQTNENNDKNFNFRALAEQNDKCFKYQMFHFYKRSQSSESKVEGILNHKIKNIQLSLPYKCVAQIRRNEVLRKWRIIIIAVQAVMRYKNARHDEYYIQLLKLPRRRKFSDTASHVSVSKKSPLKRIYSKERINQLCSKLSFAQYIGQAEGSQTDRLAKQAQSFRKSVLYKDQIQHTNKIIRLLKPRAISVQQLSQAKQRLPTLPIIDKILQQVNLTRQIRSTRLSQK